MSNKVKTPNTQWHRLLGNMLKELLTPVGIDVETGFPMMSKPPEIDILLLQRGNTNRWTPEQYARLPDGVRQSTANRIILEFKFTESVNLSALWQAIGYDSLYRRVNHLSEQEVHTFLLSSRDPNKKFRNKYSYQEKELSGVYYSDNPMLERLPIISLNKLSDAKHNAFVKCFASSDTEKKRAFDTLHSDDLLNNSPSLYWIILNLWRHWFKPRKGETDMNALLTTEDIQDLDERWLNSFLHIAPPEKMLNYLTIEDRLTGLKPEERLIGLKPEEQLIGLKPEEQLIGLKPEERMAGLTVEEIKAYLLQQEQ